MNDEQRVPGDEAPADEPSAARNACPACEGSGSVEGEACRECGGSGEVIEAVGGG